MAVSLGPHHEIVWSTKPIAINKHVHVLPSLKNRHLQDFLNKLPHGCGNVSEFDVDNLRASSCVCGKSVSHTPVGKDRDSITFDIQDLEKSDTIKVTFTGEPARDLPAPMNSVLYIYGGIGLIKDGCLSLECSDACNDLYCLFINRWLFQRFARGRQDDSSVKETRGVSPIVPVSSSSFSSSRPKFKKPKLEVNYTYTELGELVVASKVNIIGVVTFFKPPFRSRGTDYCTSFLLVDPSQQTNGINVVSFHKDEHELPNVRRVGDILMLRRVQISTYQEHPQVLSKYYSSFHVFDGADLQVTVPYCSSHNASLSNADVKLVDKLRKWKSVYPQLNPSSSLCKLRDVQFGVKFNLICRVIEVRVLIPDKLSCISLCDGTEPFMNTTTRYNPTAAGHNTPQTYHHFVCDVLVHHKFSLLIKAKQFVLLSNVISHSLYFKTSTGDTVCCASLSLYCDEDKDMSYYVLQETDPDVISLKKSLTAISYDVPAPSQVEKISSVVASTPHNSLEYTTIADVMATTHYPAKFRCQVEVIEVIAVDTTEIGNIVHLHCLNCQTRYPLVSSAESEDLSCSICSERSEVPNTRYVYEFVLKVRDETSELSLIIAEEEAERFLDNLPPSNFFIDKTAGDRVLGRLKTLFKGDRLSADDKEEPLVMDCCISACMSSERLICYRICDTVINSITTTS